MIKLDPELQTKVIIRAAELRAERWEVAFSSWREPVVRFYSEGGSVMKQVTVAELERTT